MHNRIGLAISITLGFLAMAGATMGLQLLLDGKVSYYKLTPPSKCETVRNQCLSTGNCGRYQICQALGH